jgi:acyl carrier protein
MNDQEVYLALDDIFRDIIGDNKISLTSDTTANQVEGWDSFAHINIIVAVERRFSIKFQTCEIEKMTNAGGLVATIQKKINT